MVAQCAAGQADGVGGGAQVAAYEGQVGGLDGGIGAGAHGEVEVGLGEGGRVVDAVADHRDGLALGLQALDDVDLVGGQDLGDDLVDAGLGCYHAGRRLVGSGQQYRRQAEPAEAGDGLCAGVFDRVRDDEDRSHLAVPAFPFQLWHI
jgi:hypothetical protein